MEWNLWKKGIEKLNAHEKRTNVSSEWAENDIDKILYARYFLMRSQYLRRTWKRLGEKCWKRGVLRGRKDELIFREPVAFCQHPFPTGKLKRPSLLDWDIEVWKASRYICSRTTRPRHIRKTVIGRSASHKAKHRTTTNQPPDCTSVLLLSVNEISIFLSNKNIIFFLILSKR